ncbi:hypothetical protein LCGC14_1967960 [marine sediment metagenome]|uniref:Uncharacterized protein n=1 Tax=marine sediment metagenome TaxID=412755 RepID=A0A0F9HR13_9ZZZZ
MTDQEMVDKLKSRGWLVVPPKSHKLLFMAHYPTGDDGVEFYRDFLIPKENAVVRTSE